MDSITVMRVESEDDSQLRKPQLFCLVRSCYNISCSNVFAKDRHSFAMWVYLLASARSQTQCMTPTKPMQPLFSRWFNLDKRCVVMVGSSAISNEQLQEFQEASLEVGEQETSGVCEGGCHWLYCPRISSRMTCDRNCSVKHRYCQNS